jgi:hypothetical protein
LIALIRYQYLPDRVLPAHEARQDPPVTLVATVTLVLVGMVALSRAVVYGLVRRLAVQAAAFVTLARASAGADTAVTANTKTADTIAAARMVGRAERPGRRAAWGKTDTSLGRTSRFAVGRVRDNHPMVPEFTGPDGPACLGPCGAPAGTPATTASCHVRSRWVAGGRPEGVQEVRNVGDGAIAR